MRLFVVYLLWSHYVGLYLVKRKCHLGNRKRTQAISSLKCFPPSYTLTGIWPLSQYFSFAKCASAPLSMAKSLSHVVEFSVRQFEEREKPTVRNKGVSLNCISNAPTVCDSQGLYGTMPTTLGWLSVFKSLKPGIGRSSTPCACYCKQLKEAETLPCMQWPQDYMLKRKYACFLPFKIAEWACLAISLILYTQYFDTRFSVALFIGLLVVIHRQDFNSTCSLYISYDSF